MLQVHGEDANNHMVGRTWGNEGLFLLVMKKREGGSQHLGEGGIERAESVFSSAGVSQASPFCGEPWGDGSHVQWVLWTVGAGVGLGRGGLTRPNRVCRTSPLLLHPQPRCNPLGVFSGICLCPDFNFSFCFSSSSAGCSPAQSSGAELSLCFSMAVSSHSGCSLNRNPAEAASKFCILKSENLLNDSWQISFIAWVYYYMCGFQSTTRMETCSIFNLDTFSELLCCKQNLLKWVKKYI